MRDVGTALNSAELGVRRYARMGRSAECSSASDRVASSPAALVKLPYANVYA